VRVAALDDSIHDGDSIGSTATMSRYLASYSAAFPLRVMIRADLFWHRKT